MMHDLDNNEILIEVAENILSYMEKHDLFSNDPFDIQSSRAFMWLARRKSKFFKIIRHGLIYFDRAFPRASHIFFKKKKAATSVALVASSYLLLYATKKKRIYLDKAHYHLKWLIDNYTQGYSGYCWGLPFDWQLPEKILAKAQTPCSTILIYIVDALLLGYKLTNNQIYLETAQSVGDFLMNDLNKNIIDENTVSSSYTPLDNFHVINASSYKAATLYTLSKYTNNKKSIEEADKLINYVLEEQNEDGSWCYWGRQERRNKSIDSLHQCYIIENLYRCYLINFRKEIKASIEKGLSFYINNFYSDGLISKFPLRDNRNYPFELIDHAEAIIMLSMIKNKFKTQKYASKIINYTLENFINTKKTYFYSYKWKNKSFNIPYFRWGGSQLVYSYLFYLVLISDEKQIDEIINP